MIIEVEESSSSSQDKSQLVLFLHLDSNVNMTHRKFETKNRTKNRTAVNSRERVIREKIRFIRCNLK